MKFTENDIELLNSTIELSVNNSTIWQELRRASNEPLNDFSTVFR